MTLLAASPGARIELFEVDLAPFWTAFIPAASTTLSQTRPGPPTVQDTADIPSGQGVNFPATSTVNFTLDTGVIFSTTVVSVATGGFDTLTLSATFPGAATSGNLVTGGQMAPRIRITPATENGAEISRGGAIFTACPVAAEGFERGGTGALPTPTLAVANVGQILGTWVEGAQDLIGAEVTRTVVLADWLDGNPGADPAAAITVDTFVIAQKSVQDQTKVAFVLRSPLDVRRQVPFRKAVPKCSHVYRRWDSVAVAFVAGSCPYAAAATFDFYNAAASNATDMCNRSLSGCKIRFGAAPLPFQGFPSL